MKSAALPALAVLLLASACVRPISTLETVPGRNPFTPAPTPIFSPLPGLSSTQDLHPCRAADLRTSSNSNGATGAIVLGVTIVNTSTGTCTLENPPQVSLLADGQALAVQIIPAASEEATPGPATLSVSPGESVIAILVWRNYCATVLPDGPLVRLTLPKGEQLEVASNAQAVPHCDSASDPSTLTVNPYSYPP